jgi:hypothetical protein
VLSRVSHELPEKIWLRVLQNLSVKDVNNVHLVCRNLHQIANLHVNPRLCFYWETSRKDLESLVQSLRIFEELKFGRDYDDYSLDSEKFQIIEEFPGFTGSHIKELILTSAKVDTKVVHYLPK